MSIPRHITNEATKRAQLESDYYWMLSHWEKYGIKAPPTHALRNYAFREYKRIKQECLDQLESSGKVNESFNGRKMNWHNITIFLHCIVTHPLYLSEEHHAYDRQQLKLPPLVQQLMELN